MPFVSKKQMKLCFVLQKKGLNKGWNCEEWMKQTEYKSLPVYANKTSRSRQRSRSRQPSRGRSRQPSRGKSKSRQSSRGKK